MIPVQPFFEKLGILSIIFQNHLVLHNCFYLGKVCKNSDFLPRPPPPPPPPPQKIWTTGEKRAFLASFGLSTINPYLLPLVTLLPAQSHFICTFKFLNKIVRSDNHLLQGCKSGFFIVGIIGQILPKFAISRVWEYDFSIK